MTLPLVTPDRLATRKACTPGLADFARICPAGLDPNDKAAVVAALRAGLGCWWGWAHAEGLVSSDLARADLEDADLAHADLEDADLTDANLYSADLADADLTRANLTGADLTGADLYRADLTGARYTADTVWPAGFDPAAAGAILVEAAP